MGHLQSHHKRHRLALSYFDQFFEIAAELKTSRLIYTALNNIAVIKSRLGRTTEAIEMYKRIRGISEELDDRLQLGYASRNLAEQYFSIGDYENAQKEANTALTLFREMNNAPMTVKCLIDLALICIDTDKISRASEYATKALDMAEGIPLEGELPVIYDILGVALSKQDNPLAGSYFRKSLESYKADYYMDESEGVEYTLLDFGKYLLKNGDKAGIGMLQDSAVIFRKRNPIPQTEKALSEITSLLEPYHAESLDFYPGKIIELQNERYNLRNAMGLSRLITSQVEMGSFLEDVIDRCIEISGAERGFLALLENGKQTFPVTRNFISEIKEDPCYPIINGLLDNVFDGDKNIILFDTGNAPAETGFPENMPREMQAVLIIQIKAADKILGAVYLDSSQVIEERMREIKTLLVALVDQASLVLERIRLYEEVRKLNLKLERKIKRQDTELKETKIELVNKQKELETRYSYASIIGKSGKMRDLYRLLDKVVETELPVYIYGESGTGKELVARAIHYNGPRKNGKFVAVNCAAIPESLLESELFGYEKGAFTGADSAKKGIFEASDRGTVMFDEVGDMTPSMQRKLLRVIQEKEIRRVGANRAVNINVRIVSASNKSLEDLVEKGQFREDLFYRLNVISISIPPLRERKEDIPLLFEHFWKRATNKELEIPAGEKSELYEILMNYSWPGNVRELENETNRIEQAPGGNASARFYLDEEDMSIHNMEKKLIEAALRKAGGKKSGACKLLMIPRTSLYAKMRKLGMF
jgi:Nif-specific regulatory protein